MTKHPPLQHYTASAYSKHDEPIILIDCYSRRKPDVIITASPFHIALFTINAPPSTYT